MRSICSWTVGLPFVYLRYGKQVMVGGATSSHGHSIAFSNNNTVFIYFKHKKQIQLITTTQTISQILQKFLTSYFTKGNVKVLSYLRLLSDKSPLRQNFFIHQFKESYSRPKALKNARLCYVFSCKYAELSRTLLHVNSFYSKLSSLQFIQHILCNSNEKKSRLVVSLV